MEGQTEHHPLQGQVPGTLSKMSGRQRKSTSVKGSQTTKTDDFIMDTNNSSIVSKRSVEKLYYPGRKEYFRYFVKKYQRRSPLINRGYWLRMKAVDSVVRKFLSAENGGRRKIVVNLGCGYDPNPFEYLGREAELCQDATFVDVDYPQLMHRKYEMITANPPLHELLPNLTLQPTGSAVIAKADQYLAVGCDLRELEKLEKVLRDEFDMDNSAVSILFTAEVSVAYMTLDASNAVFKWASRFEDIRFCLLEQQIPDGRDHPFARTMLKHFEKLRTPLHAVGTVDQMKERFTAAGWPTSGLNIRSLWELWADPEFLSPQERMDLDKIEPFDEWEEFALFGSHYFLMDAIKSASTSDNDESVLAAKHTPQKLQPASTYRAVPLEGKTAHRRFAGIMPGSDAVSFSVGLHGGLGTRERLNTCDVYQVAESNASIDSPPLPYALMCHTITTIGGSQGTDCLLVGGRASPDKASAAAWLRKAGVWSRVHDLPDGRYRHCAVAVRLEIEEGNGESVLVYGGKNSRSEALPDALLWSPKAGWVPVTLNGQYPEARFGAAMAQSILTGGMRQDGTIINDCWEWSLTGSIEKPLITFTEITQSFKETLGQGIQFLGRFGSMMVKTPTGQLLVGGVTADILLDRNHEVLDIPNMRYLGIESEERPLLVGFSAATDHSSSRGGVDSDILVLGGGATCFSFGTYWNSACVLRPSTEEGTSTKWHLSVPESISPPVNGAATEKGETKYKQTPATANGVRTVEQIPRKVIKTAADFELIRNESKPVILEKLDLGPCSTLWTDDYLTATIGEDRPVVVHSSPGPHMNFQSKNFSYTTQPFGAFLSAASSGSHLYLRALSTEKPSDKPTHLATDFPSIANDFALPPQLQYVQEHAHSSPLRISGPVTMWLHYDVMANVLCQIRGHKRLLLFPPTEVSKLSFPPGASSSTINPFTETHTAAGYEALMGPGDVLFLPPLWLHAAEPTEGLSVAVNVFFKDGAMEAGYAAGRDVYGNRDLAAYERGRRDVVRIAKGFDGLPNDVRRFYIARLADELRDLSA